MRRCRRGKEGNPMNFPVKTLLVLSITAYLSWRLIEIHKARKRPIKWEAGATDLWKMPYKIFVLRDE
jgi:hypothetical protein